MSKKKIEEEYILPLGESWENFEKENFTVQEIAESEARAKIICEIIDARKEQGMTQKELEEKSGIKQPVIARMENGKTDPSFTTLWKAAEANGQKLSHIISLIENEVGENFSLTD